MKFAHISDLHIGKRVYGYSMLEDQKYILEQILDLLKQEQVQGLLLAGDIYDKPIPSAEAVTMLDWFFTSLANLQIPVFAISGNHDSPERMEFATGFMEEKGIYLASVYNGQIKSVVMEDALGEVEVFLLPFIKPAVVRHVWPDAQIETYDDAVKEAIAHMDIRSERWNILVAHQFVTGASRSDSEEILVGGLDHISAELFDAFDYVALGHIHGPQFVGREQIRYCGTPLKYSFSEEHQKKSVTIITCDENSEVQVRQVPLNPLRDMRTVKGTYLEVTDLSAGQQGSREDYVQVILTDEEDIIDGLSKLQLIYPNLMHLEYDNTRTREDRHIEYSEMIEEKSELELFEEFYEMQNNQAMSSKQFSYIRDLIHDLKEEG